MESKLIQSVTELTSNQKFSVGNDLVFVPEFQHSLTDLFKNKVFTDTEKAYCDQFADALLRYASTWAAKEAVYKAVKQLNPKPLAWKNIGISRDKIAGRPTVTLPDGALPDSQISLTISHDGDYAWAIAIIEIAAI